MCTALNLRHLDPCLSASAVVDFHSLQNFPYITRYCLREMIQI